MPKNLVVVQGHPDPSGERFCHALADSYAHGALSVGAEVRRVEVGQLDFPLLRTQADFNRGLEGTPANLKPAQDAMIWSDHLMIIYPLWQGTMPALLKGFLEQTLRPGVAKQHSETGAPKPMLKGKSARVVVTMGMPAAAYRWYFWAHSLKSFERNILKILGVKPILESLYGSIEAVSDEKRKKWIDAMHVTGTNDVR